MAKGILGRKIGMTQVFAENGDLIPVTVIEAAPNVVLQKKTVETDGYNAIQVGFEDKRVKLSNKPEQGHVAKANTAPKRFIREFRNVEGEVGQEVKVEIFAEACSHRMYRYMFQSGGRCWTKSCRGSRLQARHPCPRSHRCQHTDRLQE